MVKSLDCVAESPGIEIWLWDMSYISFRDWKSLSIHPAVNGELLEYGPVCSSGTRALTIFGCIRILQVEIIWTWIWTSALGLRWKVLYKSRCIIIIISISIIIAPSRFFVHNMNMKTFSIIIIEMTLTSAKSFSLKYSKCEGINQCYNIVIEGWNGINPANPVTMVTAINKMFSHPQYL